MIGQISGINRHDPDACHLVNAAKLLQLWVRQHMGTFAWGL
jgi:hypothetical protein